MGCQVWRGELYREPNREISFGTFLPHSELGIEVYIIAPPFQLLPWNIWYSSQIQIWIVIKMTWYFKWNHKINRHNLNNFEISRAGEDEEQWEWGYFYIIEESKLVHYFGEHLATYVAFDPYMSLLNLNLKVGFSQQKKSFRKWKRPNNKYFQLYTPYILCHNYWTLPMQWESNHRQWARLYSIKLFYKNRWQARLGQ